ncbi:hypothetical protein H9638_04465 [Arthrobacter sp. Sa2BUA2]|uniref:Uncharacterized protein n=1 Tax=Arthrobacter pullicola TaxID=2762224 RepID=A0ABR8YG14_9MICC|nr:hypothetical protein [Arthrobacter pullicola]MBD8043061.1 hypothetical protein [Arthrobacter pullicola]
MERKTARTAPLLLIAFAAVFFFTACATGGGEEDMSSSPAASAEESMDPACKTGPQATSASCQAAGPGTTVEANRCPSTSPSALEGGVIEGAFGPWCENAIATAYDTELIPAGAEAELTLQETDLETTMEMQVQGFAADTAYSGMLHSQACGDDASAAGPEYVQEDISENVPAGLALDFTTDADGSADASVTVPWVLPDNGSGKSILLFSADNQAAGCVTLP